MKKHIKSLAIFGGLAFLLAFVLFVINQVAALHNNLSSINPLMANVVVGALTLLFGVLVAVPILIYFRLPKPIDLPSNELEKEAFLQQLGKRLAKNKHLVDHSFDYTKQSDIKKALEILEEKANQVIQATSTSVFLTTAISQNGKLDALTVLVTQTKMVWEISHIYWQRPAIRDMVNLYSNVGATAFLASEVEDLDISRQIEPILGAMFKSPGKSLPIVGHAAHIIMDSILEGSVNAFLTLRVGIICKQYCGSMEVFNKKTARSYAFIEASGLLKTLVVKSSSQVINSLVKATKRTGMNTVKSGVSAIERAARSMKDGLGELADKMGISRKELDKTNK